MASSPALASRRLFSEFKALSTEPPAGIVAGPVAEEDLFVWEALIEGPEGTPFEGGVLCAELVFPKASFDSFARFRRISCGDSTVLNTGTCIGVCFQSPLYVPQGFRNPIREHPPL